MTDFYMKHNTGLKWVNPIWTIAPFLYALKHKISVYKQERLAGNLLI